MLLRTLHRGKTAARHTHVSNFLPSSALSATPFKSCSADPSSLRAHCAMFRPTRQGVGACAFTTDANRGQDASPPSASSASSSSSKGPRFMNKLKGRSVTQTESVDVSAREDKGVDIKVDRRGLLKYSDPVMDEKDFEQLSSDYQLNDKKSEASTAAPAAEVDVDAGVGEVKTEKSPQSALGKELKSLMRLNGPMTVAEFMLQCSGAPNKGYYMKKDVFGTGGDFITSPEITQMFGEIIGIWCVATWEQLGKPSKFKLAEIGPGRGKLMDDVLRTVRRFPEFNKAISAVHFIETSDYMRELQRKRFKVEPDYKWDPAVADSSDGIEDKDLREKRKEAEIDAQRQGAVMSGKSSKFRMNLPMYWHLNLRDLQQTEPILLVGHELFDALPIHQFQYTERGWREKLVDIDDTPDGEHHFRFVLSPGPTHASQCYVPERKATSPSSTSVAGGDTVTLHTPSSSSIDVMKQSNTDDQDDDDMDVSGMFDETDMRTVFDDPNPSFSSSSSSPSPGLVSSTGSSDAAASPLVKSDGSAVASSTPHSTPQLDLNLDNLDNFTTNNDEANRNAINNMSTQTHTGRNAHMGGKSSVNLNQLQDFNDSLDGMGSQNKISALNTLNNENQPLPGALSDVFDEEEKIGKEFEIGATYEVCPQALALAEEVTRFIHKAGGAALFVDYGEDAPLGTTLQGVKEHKYAHVLSEVGDVDLSALVNFKALSRAVYYTNSHESIKTFTKGMQRYSDDKEEAARAVAELETGHGEGVKKVSAHALAKQNAFLMEMGIRDLLEMYLSSLDEEKDEEKIVNMISAYERLVDPEQMGELFKFFCISEALPEPQAAGPTPASSDNVVHVETDCDAAVDTDSGDDMNTKTKLTGLPPGFVHTRFPDFQVMGGADVQTQE